jgi:hypothetical protein
MGQIQVKNVSSATVVITAPDVRLRRELVPGRTVGLTSEEFEELSFDPGMQNLLRAGYLKVTGKDEEAKELVQDAVSQAQEGAILSVEEIRKIYANSDITTFAKTIANASPATRETMVKLAVEMNITLPAFTALIKKYCDVDVIQAIAYAHQAAEKE